MEKQDIKNQIVNEKEHCFIMAPNNEGMTSLLKEIEEENGLTTDCDKPMAIYLHDFSLPLTERINQTVERNKIKVVAKEFLHFSMAQNIVEKMVSEGLEERSKELVTLLNNFILKGGVKDLKELEEILRQSRDFFSQYYVAYLKGEEQLIDLKKLRMFFIDINWFANCVKNSLNNNAHFSMILNKTESMPLVSEMAINDLISRSSNPDILMKIAIEKDGWQTYRGLNGMLAEYIRDYGVMELDDTFNKKLTKTPNNS